VTTSLGLTRGGVDRNRNIAKQERLNLIC